MAFLPEISAIALGPAPRKKGPGSVFRMLETRPVVARVTLAIALLALVSPGALGQDAPPPAVFSGAERLVAVGDVHGGFDEFVQVLKLAGVVDKKLNWSGGKTHFVQTGDVLDRGPDSRKVMDLLMKLEKQAPKKGGRAILLLGNHEVMNLLGDLRYVSPGEYAAFATGDSAAVRDAAFELLADPARKDDPAYRKAWDAEHPLGWVEHRQAFSSRGKYGKWLRERNAVVKVDGYLFVHGGIPPSLADSSIQAINDRVREELRSVENVGGALSTASDGPFWYRGLALEPEDAIAGHVDRVLANFGVSHIVIGHTTMPGAVLPRLGGKVLLIDVGLSKAYGSRQACLVVERGTALALHRGSPLALPLNAPNEAVLAYLRSAAALDPAPSPLLPLIDAGGYFPASATADDKPQGKTSAGSGGPPRR
jgi:hypothetical protein